jgi:cation:H+ antiporter
MILIYFLLLVGFSLLLIKATEILTDSLQELARITRIGKFAITSLLLAFATSVPELVVGITAALEGRPNMALGTVLGSNIADISLVIGGAAVIGGSFSVAGEFLRLDIFSVFLAGVLPLMLLLDNKLSRVDGIILLLVYGIYNFGLLRNKLEAGQRRRGTSHLLRRMWLSQSDNKRLNRWLAWLCLGAAMLVFSADMVVKTGAGLATQLGVPVFLIGLFLVAVGTSLPELSFEIGAVKRRQVGMVLGDLLGSVVANSTLILGLVSLINPIRLVNGLNAYLLASAAFGVMFLLFWLFVKSKKKLERWEGLILIGVYIMFVLLEWFRTT